MQGAAAAMAKFATPRTGPFARAGKNCAASETRCADEGPDDDALSNDACGRVRRPDVRAAVRLGKTKARGRFRRGLRTSCDDVSMPMICPTRQILRKYGRHRFTHRNRLRNFQPQKTKSPLPIDDAGHIFLAMVSICA
jgi:hypothetical protein